jgi:hypothetical protein
MNERIEQLETQCWISRDGYQTFDRQKFAELIINECTTMIESDQWAQDNQSWSRGMRFAAGLIKERFGVEE